MIETLKRFVQSYFWLKLCNNIAAVNIFKHNIGVKSVYNRFKRNLETT